MRKTKLLTGVSMLALAMTIAVGISASPAKTVKAAGDVEINETNFPDEFFRSWIQRQEYGKDGVLTADEISDIKEIEIFEIDVSSLQGIEFFTSLEKLQCLQTDLSSLDLSKNTMLKKLDCGYNELTSLNISENSALEELYCNDNKLTSIDVSNNSALIYLDCSNYKFLREGNNQFKSLDISNNINLKGLSCVDVNLSGLNVSSNINLSSLHCNNNQLTSLDVSKNKELASLVCSDNKLKSLDVSKNDKLSVLTCSNNNLEKLNIGIKESLDMFNCKNNDLNEVDVSRCPQLIKLYMHGLRKDVYDGIYYVNNDYYADPDYKVYFDDYISPTYLQIDNALGTGKLTSCLVFDSNADLVYETDYLQLNKSNVSVVCGKTITLKATLKDDSAKAKWISSDKSIAKVSDNGKITAKKAGTVCVTVTADGALKECIVTVLYKDVTNSKDFWFKPTNYLTAAGVVKGYDKQTKFKPANECTRAQMVTFLYRLAGAYFNGSGHTEFTDVKSTDYFCDAVYWALNNGITTGVSKTKFDPQRVCTRAQTVTFLWRMADKPEPDAKTCKFSDVKEKDYFYKPVIWASEKKIVAGYKDGTFKPQGKCLRRQMVTFLYKYDKYINGKG